MYEDAERTWESAKGLFYHNKVADILNKEIGHSNIRSAVALFMIAGLISTAVVIASTATAFHMAEFEFKTVAEITGAENPEVEWDSLVPLAVSQFIFLVPFSLIFSLAYEGIMYKIFKLTGGKGTFNQQYYLSSIVAVSSALASSLSILAAVPLLQILAGLGLLFFIFYFGFYVGVKVYEKVHDVAFLHSFVIVVLLLVPKILVLSLASNFILSIFGLPNIYEIGGVEYGI